MHSARNIPQIYLLLGEFECKKLLIKNCRDFLRNSIESPKLFFTYLRNTLEDIIHGKYVTWRGKPGRKVASPPP